MVRWVRGHVKLGTAAWAWRWEGWLNDLQMEA